MGTANATSYKDLAPPTSGESITMRDGRLDVPNEPIVPFIEGDGTGPDIWRASQHVFDSAVKKAYGAKRQIVLPIPAAILKGGKWEPFDVRSGKFD